MTNEKNAVKVVSEVNQKPINVERGKSMSRTPNVVFVSDGVVFTISPNKLKASLLDAAKTGTFDTSGAKPVTKITLTTPTNKEQAAELLATLFPAAVAPTPTRRNTAEFEDLTDAEDVTPQSKTA